MLPAAGDIIGSYSRPICTLSAPIILPVVVGTPRQGPPDAMSTSQTARKQVDEPLVAIKRVGGQVSELLGIDGWIGDGRAARSACHNQWSMASNNLDPHDIAYPAFIGRSLSRINLRTGKNRLPRYISSVAVPCRSVYLSESDFLRLPHKD